MATKNEREREKKKKVIEKYYSCAWKLVKEVWGRKDPRYAFTVNGWLETY